MSALNPGSKVFKLVLRRDDPSQSWGFRLQGGKDFPMPVSVAMVNPGGLADQNGMSAQDAVLQINGINTHELDHEQAKYEIVKAGNEVTFLLQRGAVTVWRPQVTKLSDLKGPGGAMPPGYDETFVQKTSLAANKPEPVRIGSAHNRSARPFPGFGGGSAQPAAPQPVSAPAAASQPPPQQYQPPPQQQYQPPPQQQFQPPPQQYSPQPQQYGGQPPQSYGQPPQQQQFNQPPQQYNQPPQQYNQPPQQYNPPPQQYNQAPPPSQYQPSQYGQSQPSPYGQSQPSQPSPPNYPPPNAQSQFPGGPPIDDGVGGKGLVHAQYNSPMGMYSNENIVNTFQAHANVLAQDLNKNDSGNAGPAAVQQQGYRSVSAPAAKPPGEIQQQQPQQLMTCKGCGGLCTGVFIRIKGAPIHAECFKCVKCGVHLKNIGYFEVEGRFYCETHAKQVAQPPEPGMVAVPTYQ